MEEENAVYTRRMEGLPSEGFIEENDYADGYSDLNADEQAEYRNMIRSENMRRKFQSIGVLKEGNDIIQEAPAQ